MTEKEMQDLSFALETTWQAIGMDVLADIPSGSISRDEVVELVLDADRLETYCDEDSKPTVKKFRELPYIEQIAVAKKYFIFERYGY